MSVSADSRHGISRDNRVARDGSVAHDGSVARDGGVALESMSLPERVEHLRRRMAAVPSKGETRSVARPSVSRSSAPVSAEPSAPDNRLEQQKSTRAPAKEVLSVPEALAAVLPHGGLVRGSVTAVSGAGSLMLGMVASVTAAGGHVAVVGQPRFGLLAASEMGAQLHRLAMVPDPGEDPVEVAAILLDGVDLVVLGLGGRSVPPSRARAVVARARSKGASLLVTDGHWDGVDLRLDASVAGVDGVGTGDGAGRGRLRGLRLEVRAQGKAMRTRSTRFDLRSERGRVEWFEVPSVAAVGADRVAVLA